MNKLISFSISTNLKHVHFCTKTFVPNHIFLLNRIKKLKVYSLLPPLLLYVLLLSLLLIRFFI